MADHHISDQSYNTLSKLAYQDLPEGMNLDSPGLEGWEVVVPDGAKLHSKVSGFDAMVVRNPETDQVVISYRGTDGIADYETDAFDVVGGRVKDLEETLNHPIRTTFIGGGPAKLAADKIAYENNQFHQAEELYAAVQKEYPNADISLTGHSLGGGLAQYVAVRQDIPAVTYSAPTSLNLLADDLADQVRNGDFDSKIINYVHPSDSVGAGPFGEYERHVGSTYYIGNDFDGANAKYTGLEANIPVTVPMPRLPGMPGGFLQTKIGIDLDKLGLGHLVRFKDSVFNKATDYHSADQYKFDENGNIINPLVNRVTGERFTGSPRAEAHEGMRMGNKLGGRAGAGGANGTIQLTPEELKTASRTMRGHIQETSQETTSSISAIHSLMNTSESRSLTPIIERSSGQLQQINQWYATTVAEIANYIDRKADEFIRADLS